MRKSEFQRDANIGMNKGTSITTLRIWIGRGDGKPRIFEWSHFESNVFDIDGIRKEIDPLSIIAGSNLSDTAGLSLTIGPSLTAVTDPGIDFPIKCARTSTLMSESKVIAAGFEHLDISETSIRRHSVRINTA